MGDCKLYGQISDLDLTVTKINSALHPSRVSKPSTNLHGWGYGGAPGAFIYVGRRLLYNRIWQVTLRSSEMGFL